LQFASRLPGRTLTDSQARTQRSTLARLYSSAPRIDAPSAGRKTSATQRATRVTLDRAVHQLP
jgi:hypothetical protein